MPQDQRLKVFRHLHALDLDFHLNRRTGGLSRDIERGTNGISFLLRFMVFNILPTLLEIGMVIGLLLWNYDVWFALIVAVSVAAAATAECSTRMSRSISRYSGRASTSWAGHTLARFGGCILDSLAYLKSPTWSQWCF